MRWSNVREALVTQGLKPGVWFTDSRNLGYTPGGATFVIAEDEGPEDGNGILAHLSDFTIPHAIVTNFSNYVGANGLDDPALAAPLIANGWECLTEAYLSDNPQATPDALDFRAKKLGWARTQPVFGTYGGKTLADYEAWQDWPGWSAYLAEYIL